jgi:hypothetical protein
MGFELRNENFKYLKDYGEIETLEEAEEAAQSVAYDYGEAIAVHKIVDQNGYPDRKIVSIWGTNGRQYKTYRWDEDTATVGDMEVDEDLVE